MARVCEILVVEDEADLATVVRDLLSEEGYRVTVAASHATAGALLAVERFDVVLLDSPGAALGEAAWAAMARLRALAGDTPVVLFTAHHPALVGDVAAHGFAAVVHKPFDLEQLLAVVDRELPADCEAAPDAA
jgi:CheY-like chemotaxis protein